MKNAMATAAGSMDYVVITLVDSGSSNKDDFLGQAFVRLSDIKNIRASATKPHIMTVQVKDYLCKVTDAKGDVATVRKACSGSITISLSVPKAHTAMCGWLWKVRQCPFCAVLSLKAMEFQFFLGV